MDPDEAILEAEFEPQFLDDTERELFAEVMLGEEAIAFWNSDLGQVFRGHLTQDRQEALEELGTVGWWRRRKIKQLQDRVRFADRFIMFFREVLTRSRVAEHGLAQMREE